jgi:hypothetical protein
MKTSTVTSAAKALGLRFRRAYRQKEAIKLYDAIHMKECRCCKGVQFVPPDRRVLRKLGRTLGEEVTVWISNSGGILNIYIGPLKGT